MRYALVSDIHANLQAWKAVLLDIRSARIDRILCLGDIIGYGPNPVEVIESVYANVDHLLLGNHDAVIAGKLNASLFNPAAREIIDWTSGKLSQDAVHFLSGLPMSIDGGLFRCVHGDFSDPAAYNYIIEPEDAQASWNAVSHPLLFAGHTHRPGIFLTGESGKSYRITPRDFALEDGKRFLVNVGSVGQPRDGRILASYCIFDSVARSVFWRSIPFDIDTFKQALSHAGLPEGPDCFLRHDPRQALPPLRNLLDFSPARTPDQRAKNTIALQSLEGLEKRARLWRTCALLAFSAGLGLAALFGSMAWNKTHRKLIIPPPALELIESADFSTDVSLVEIPAAHSPPGSPITGWRVELGHRRKQTARVMHARDKTTGQIQLESETGDSPITLRSNEIRVTPGMKFRAEGFFKVSEDFSGNIGLVIRFLERKGQIRKMMINPNIIRRDNWRQAKRTFEVPAGFQTMDVGVEGRFTGRVRIENLILRRRNP